MFLFQLPSVFLVYPYWLNLIQAQLFAELLKDLDCEEVEYVYRETIPAGHGVFFKPSGKMQHIIDEANRLETYMETISIDQVKFASDGTKFIKHNEVSE